MGELFDKYANEYVDIINRGSKITGEKFEYFINLRVQLMRRKIREIEDSPSHILDFGCGIGYTEKVIRNYFPNSFIVGIDRSEISINKANSLNLLNTQFICQRSLSLPFADNTFDVIYSNGTFHHIEHSDHTSIFREFLRILKRNGHFFVFENNPYNPLMMRAMKNNPFDKDAHVIYPVDLKKRTLLVGFKIKGVNYYMFYPKWFKILRWTERYIRFVPLGAQYFLWGTKKF